MVTARIRPCGWHHSKALDALDTIVGSDPLNGQELATRGTITHQVQDLETTLRGYNILVGTVRQVDIEKNKTNTDSVASRSNDRNDL